MLINLVGYMYNGLAVDHSPGTRGHPTNVKLKQNESEHNR